MREFKEIAIAVFRMILSLVALMGALVVIDMLMYVSFTNSTYDETVLAAYYDGYNDGYITTYQTNYWVARDEAYDKGYNQWLVIGQEGQPGDVVISQIKLRNPTYMELQAFLGQDQTNNRRFVRGEYVCFDFAAALNNNAEASGIRAAYVRIRSREWAHAIAAFETVDKGLVFIEPQSDREVRLTVGEPYPWLHAGAIPSMYSNEPIVEVQIIW